MSLNDLRFFVPGQLMENLSEMAAQLAENSLPASCGDDNDVVLTVPARVAQSLVLFQAWLSASLGAEENSRRPPERSNLGESSGKAGGLPHRVAFGENPNRCYFQGNWDFRALVAALYQPTARACAPRHRPLKKKATSRQSVMKCGRLLTKSNKQWIWLAIDRDSREIVGMHVGNRDRTGAGSAQYVVIVQYPIEEEKGSVGSSPPHVKHYRILCTIIMLGLLPNLRTLHVKHYP